MTIHELIEWLRDNSSGIYSPSAEAADLIEQLMTAAGISMHALDTISDQTMSDGHGGHVAVGYRSIARDALRRAQIIMTSTGHSTAHTGDSRTAQTPLNILTGEEE